MEGREIWYVSRGTFVRRRVTVHWKGHALQYGGLAAILVWMLVSVRFGLIENKTWLFALVAAVIGVAVMVVMARHTRSRS